MEEIKEKLSYREKANSTPRFSLLTIENYFNIHGIITEAPQRTEWFFNIISFNIHASPLLSLSHFSLRIG